MGGVKLGNSAIIPRLCRAVNENERRDGLKFAGRNARALAE
jgi:hypothetical protein